MLQCYELPFEQASAIKYLVRAGRKSPKTTLQDLYKAMEFIQRRIDWLTSDGS